jgi:hypothetical protein
MDKKQQRLVELLSSAIHNQEFDVNMNDSIDWNYIFEEAVAHQVHTLLYPVISNLGSGYGPDAPLMKRWHTATILFTITQFQHIQQISEVFHKFNSEHIPVIALKGLIIRECYPEPELRTMGDADILIHKEDMEKVDQLLIELGYVKGEASFKHTGYNHAIFPSIEVHLSLMDDDKFSYSKDFTESVWNNAVDTQINGVNALTLSPEDQVLHLILHMANHMKSSGFGLRQICDLTLFVKKNLNQINWLIISEKVERYMITQFTYTIFAVCYRLFQLKIPDLFNKQSIVNSPYIDELISDILAGGVFGKRGEERVIGSQMLNYIEDKRSESITEGIRRVCTFAFPSSKKLNVRYGYAKKYYILLPIAWIHRFIYNLSRKNMITYFKTIFSNNKNSTFEKRSKLLRWLELR